MNKSVDYEQEYELSEGVESCQDMTSSFLRMMGGSAE